jgi:RNA polymerase sigma-70 factor (ECF subfamily)
MAEGSLRRDDTRLYLLVLRCQAGDAAAFDRLMREFGERTLAHLRGIVGDDADDVQQEVWFTVYRQLSGLSNPRAFRTWLFQTTRHRAIDFLRARKRERELADEAAREMDLTVAPVNEPSDLDVSSLGAALNTLIPIHREVLVLRYQEDMGYGDIAIVVGCSIGTIRSRLHAAKRRLQEALRRETP